MGKKLNGAVEAHLLTQVRDSRHAQDSSVEVQRFGGIFDPQHRLLHHVVLQRPEALRQLTVLISILE